MRFILISFLILYSISLSAETGHCYCFEVEIVTMESDTVKGYFNFADEVYMSFNEPYLIGNSAFDSMADTFFVRKNDGYRLFFSDASILERTFLNSKSEFIIYEDVFYVNYDSPPYGSIKIPKLIGNSARITRSNIRELKLIQMIRCEVGLGIYTQLESNDKREFENKDYMEAIEIGCHESRITLLLYQKPQESTVKLIEQFKSTFQKFDYKELDCWFNEFKELGIIGIGLFDC